MFENQLNDEIVSIIRRKVKENPSIMPMTMAQELNISEGAVIQALPLEMRVFAPADDFAIIWKEMSKWEKVTFIARNSGIIAEFSGQLPKGFFGNDMFNLREKDHPLGGHILVEKIKAIFFVSKPIFKLESHSIQFFTSQGAQAFGIYAGRDSKRQLLDSVTQGFMTLHKRYMNTMEAT